MHGRFLSGQVLAYIFCAFPFASAFCEDLEHRYILYSVSRGNIRNYAISKIINIYLSSFVTMVLGVFIFTIVCRIWVPWGFTTDSFYSYAINGCYGMLIAHGHYVVYCLLYAVNLGMLAGTLSVLASTISLFICSKVMIITIPVLLMQILYETANKSVFSVFAFEAYNKFFSTDIQCFLFIFVLSILPVICAAKFILYRIPQKL